MSTSTERPRRRWTRRIGAGLALVGAVAVVVAIVLLSGSSPAPSEASSGQAGSVTVSRRDLVQTDTESGTVGYSDPQTVYDRLSGTITWLPPVGQRIGRGQTLFRVDGLPVPLLYGTTPAYRSLGPADTAGPDVAELNANLVALGYNAGAIVVNDVWQPATTLGVDQFQAALGETETGVLSLGQVVFLPGRQLVASLDGTVGATSGGGGGGGGAGGGGSAAGAGSTSGAAATPGSSPHEFVGLVVGLSGGHGPASQPPSPKRHHPVKVAHPTRPAPDRELTALAALLKAESAQLRAQSAQLRAQAAQLRAAKTGARSGRSSASSTSGDASSSADSAGASAGASPTAVLETTSTHLVVTVDLPASAQGEAQVGQPVSVQLPAGNTVAGRITAVSRIAQNSSGSGSGSGNGNGGGGGSGSGSGGSGSSSTVPVTISLHGHLRAAGLDQAAVSVGFAQQRANHVLSVPVTALLAVPGGTYDLQEATPPHRLIPVQTGLFAAGYVQVSGPGVYPGLSVTASQG